MYCFNSFAVGRVTPPVSKRANPLVSGLKAIIRLTAQCPVLQIRKRKGEVAIDGTLQPTEPVIVQDVLAGTLRPFSFFFVPPIFTLNTVYNLTRFKQMWSLRVLFEKSLPV